MVVDLAEQARMNMSCITLLRAVIGSEKQLRNALIYILFSRIANTTPGSPSDFSAHENRQKTDNKNKINKLQTRQVCHIKHLPIHPGSRYSSHT